MTDRRPPASEGFRRWLETEYRLLSPDEMSEIVAKAESLYLPAPERATEDAAAVSEAKKPDAVQALLAELDRIEGDYIDGGEECRGRDASFCSAMREVRAAVRRLAPERPRWTSVPPDGPGWFFVRGPELDEPIAVQVVRLVEPDEGEEPLQVWYDGDNAPITDYAAAEWLPLGPLLEGGSDAS